MTKEEIICNNFWDGWGDLSKGQKDRINKAMDEYAKQQAIAFMTWAIENGKVLGNGNGDAFIADNTEEGVYNQFIEQQNKGNG